MNLCNEFVYMGDRMFSIKRKIKTFNPEQYVEELKVLFNCDTVLKKDGVFFFCDEVKTVEIIEEIRTNSQS